MHRFQEPTRNVPLPKDEDKEYKFSVRIGTKVFIFDSEDEGKDFVYLIRLKHIPVDEAYEYIQKLKKEGRYSTDSQDPEELNR